MNEQDKAAFHAAWEKALQENDLLVDRDDFEAGWDAALAHRDSQTGWQPIETAPKDGNGILAWDGWEHQVAYWSDTSVFGRKAWVHGPATGNYNSREEFEPTHWMPLPQPPREQS